MPALASKLSPRSDDFKANAAAMRALVDDLNAKLERIAQGGGDGPRAKQEGAPVHRAAVARGRRLDPLGRDVRVGRGEIEIEVDR